MQSTQDNENNLDTHQDSERGKKRPSNKFDESSQQQIQQMFFHNKKQSETNEDLKLESLPNSESYQKQQQKRTEIKRNNFKKSIYSLESDGGSEEAHNMFASPIRDKQAMHSEGLVHGGIEKIKSKLGQSPREGRGKGAHNSSQMKHPMRRDSPNAATFTASDAKTAILQKFKINQQQQSQKDGNELMGDSRTSIDIIQKNENLPVSPEQVKKAMELRNNIVDTNKKNHHMSQSMGSTINNNRLTVQTRTNPLQGGLKQSKEEINSSSKNVISQLQPKLQNNYDGIQRKLSSNNQIFQIANSKKNDVKVPTTKATQKKVIGASSPASDQSSQSSSNINSMTSSDLSDSSVSSDSSIERSLKKKEDSILNKSSAVRKKIDEVNVAKIFIQKSMQIHQTNNQEQQKLQNNHQSPPDSKANQVAPMTLMTQEGDQFATPNDHGDFLFSHTPYIAPHVGPVNNDQPDSSRRLVQQEEENVVIQHEEKIRKSKTYKDEKKLLRRNQVNSKDAKKKNVDEIMPDYQDFFARINANNDYGYRQIHPEVNKKCILVPDDPLKTKWEMITSLILIFTAVTTPLQLAFSDSDNLTWTVINYMVDGIFFIDIFVSFFSAYEGEDEGELEYNHWKIAKRYITSWFFIDVMTILPVSEFLQSGDFTNLARVARLPKLYRLIRMVKLIRIMKIVKERNTISKYLNEYLKIGVAMERLSFFCFIFVILVHIVSCFWVIISSFEDNDENIVMHNELQDLSASELYLACFYYTTIIVTTIGYGDITVRTPIEQVFALILLIIGVIGFSFAIGSLSTVLSSLDAKAGKLQEKMDTLNNIKEEYKIPYDLYRRLRLALNYDHSKKNEEQQNFLNLLPAQLKVELSVVMHQDIVNQIKFLKHKSPHFIAFLMPLLRPIKVEEKGLIYKEGDPIDEIYFLTSGQAGYVLSKKYDSVAYYEIGKGYYFGEIDFIYCDEDNNNDGKRKFTAMAIQDSDLLVLKKIDLLAADQEFEDVISDLFLNAAHRLKRTIKLKRRCKAFYKNLRKQQENQEIGEGKNGLNLGHTINDDSSRKESKPGMLLSLNKLSMFNSSSTTKKTENYKNAFLNDLKKKMGTQSLDLEALDEAGKDIEDVLSEEISTPQENDSDRLPQILLDDVQKFHKYNAEKTFGEQNAFSGVSSQDQSKAKTINNAPAIENEEKLTLFLTNQKSMINETSHFPLQGEHSDGKLPKSISRGKNLHTQSTHSIMRLKTRLNGNLAQQKRNNEDSDESPKQHTSNKAHQLSSRRKYEKQNEENDAKNMFQNSNLDDQSDYKFQVKPFPSESIQFFDDPQNFSSQQNQLSIEKNELIPFAAKNHKNNFFEEVKISDFKDHNSEEHSSQNQIQESKPYNESGKKTVELISGSIRWNLMKQAMIKKNGGSNPQTFFKTPQVAVEAHNKIQEKRKNIINQKHKSFLNTIINDSNLQETNQSLEKVIDQDNYDAKIYQLLNQIENDNKIRYAQINQRISKFETILGEISLIMHDLNEPPMSIQNMEHAGQGGIDETVHQQQIKNLLRKAYQVQTYNAPETKSSEEMD